MKILVIRLSSLGDIVLTSGVILSLKERFPNSSLFFLTKKEYAKIVKLFVGVDKILLFDKEEGLFPLIKRTRDEKFDILIDLSKNIRSIMISILSGCKRRFSYKKLTLERRLLLSHINLFKESIHISERYISEVLRLGIRYKMPNLSTEKINKEEILEKFGIGDGLICGIACGSRHKNKNLSIEGYVGLIERLSKKFNCLTILFGSKDDEALAGKIKSACKAPVKDLVGKTDLIELSILIERCFLFISPDTGPMHIADSLKTPVVAIFGPTTRHFGFFPLNGVIVEKELPCRPCSLHGGDSCKMGDNRCMKISVDDIISAIHQILNKKPYLPYKPDKILVVETAFLGDCLLTTPLIRAIKELFPSSSISFLARPIGCEALGNNPYISSFIPYDKDKKGFLEFLRIVKMVKNENFSLAILPHRSAKTTLISWLSNIPKRIGFDNAGLSFLLTERVHYNRKRHEAERKLSLIKAQDERGFDIFVDDSGRGKRDMLFSQWGIKKDDILVGILPFSHWKTKRWIEKGFAKVIDGIMEHKAKVIIFGSHSDLDAANKIKALARENPIIACGISISYLSSFFERCNLIIGNDTGIIHIAYGLDKKTLVIFGPTTPELGFGPYKTTSTFVLQKPLPCRPCSLHGPNKCPKKHFNCMKQIKDEDVLNHSLKLLGI